ncbi:unnamed protein product, partial [Cochlearia groenlandica]
SSHLNALDNQVAQITSTSKRPMGQLPGKADTNPREYVNSIELRCGTQVHSSDLIEDNAKQDEGVDQSIKPEDTVINDENPEIE